MRVPLLSKNGSGKFGMGVSAARGPGAGDAGQSAPVFSWSKTNGSGPSVEGSIAGMSPGCDGGCVAGVPADPGGLVSVGVNGRALGFSSPVSVAAGTAPEGSRMPSPSVAGALGSPEGVGGVDVPEGLSVFVFASEHALPVHTCTSSGTDKSALRETSRELAIKMRAIRSAIRTEAVTCDGG